MNIISRFETIVIAVITAIIAIILTVWIMEVTSIATLKKEITRQDARTEKQNAVIFELAKIEKYKIENKFDQVKAKDGQIVLSLDNKLSTLQLDSIRHSATDPASALKGKTGFWSKFKFW